MRFRDSGYHYGVVSLLLHWATALVVIALLFIGNSISVSGDDMLRLHTSIALLGIPLFIFRIYWRLKAGHAAPLPRQKPVSFMLGKITHYVLLAGIVIMIVSGPLMAWSGNLPIRFFALISLYSQSEHSAETFAFFHSMHQFGASLLGYGNLLHMGAVLKHSIFDKDGTFGKIMTTEGPVFLDIDLDDPPTPGASGPKPLS